MPIDPRIPLGGQSAPVFNPLELYGQIAQIQGLKGQGEIRRLQAEAEQRAAKAEQALRDMVSLGPDGQPQIDYQKGLGHLGADKVLAVQEAAGRLTKVMADARVATQSADEKSRTYLGGLAEIVRASGDDPQTFELAVTTARLKGALPESEAMQSFAFSRDPAFRKTVIDRAIALAGPKPPGDLERVQTVDAQGRTVTQFIAPTVGSTYLSPPPPAARETTPAVGSFEDYVVRRFGPTPTAAQITEARKAYQQADDRPAVTVNTGAAADDVKQIVQGMMDGTLPPQLPGRASPAYNAIMAEAQRRGFDLAGAVTDWVATQKHTQTMNGAQQLRLTQAINALPEMLDSVASLARQWKAGRFAALNRVSLAAAKHGVYGPQAATIANQLDAQIADVVADLGNVYMGGNSPTDHALSLAGKSLNAEWDERVLLDMVALAKKNVQIRLNSIRSTGVAGASETNPYAPVAPVPAHTPTGPPAAVPAAPGTTGGLTYQDYLRAQGKK